MTETKLPAMTAAMREQLYCGCCGGEIGQSSRTDPDWCRDCGPHILRKRRDITSCWSPPWELTYFAQTGQDCPFQVSTEEANR